MGCGKDSEFAGVGLWELSGYGDGGSADGSKCLRFLWLKPHRGKPVETGLQKAGLLGFDDIGGVSKWVLGLESRAPARGAW